MQPRQSFPLSPAVCFTLLKPTHFLPTSHRHRMKSSRNNKTEDQPRSSTLGSCLLSAALYLPLWRLLCLTLLSTYALLFSRILQCEGHYGSCWCVFVCLVTGCVIFSWNKLCLTLRSVLVQRLEEWCVCVWIQRDVLKHWLVSCARAVVFTCWHLPSPFTHKLVHWP